MTATPVVRHLDPNVALAVFDRVLLQLWRGEATPQAVQRLHEMGKELVARHEGVVCSSLSVVESTSPPPNDRVRPLLTACYRELAPHLVHQLFVAEGSGFRVALVRGVGLAVSALAPSFLPFKFASSVAEAASTIAPTLSAQAGGAPALSRAVELLRERLSERAP